MATPTFRTLTEDDVGRLPDIFISDVSLEGQERLLAALSRSYDVVYRNDEGEAELPSDEADLALLVRPRDCPTVKIMVGTIQINWFLYGAVKELCLDFDIREIVDEGTESALVGFLTWLGDTTGRPVRVQPEGFDERAMIASYDPTCDTSLRWKGR